VASTRSTIEIEIRAQVERFRDACRGAEVQLRRMARAVDDNEKAFDRWGKGIAITLKSLAAIGAVGNAVGFVVALTSSLSNLLPIVALAPAAIFSLVAAIATFKLATAGFSDALKGNADALAKLAPSARETVQQVNALKPAFDNLRKAVQQEFFKNFAGDLKLISDTFLPVLLAKLPRIAAAFNDMGRSITRALTTNGAADDINIALTNTAKLLENARNAVGHLVSAFIPLIAVGSTYLPNIGIAIDGAADRFRAWSQQVTSDGSLRAMIDGAITGFRTLGELIGNFGEIASAVFRGLSTGPQQDFLTALRDSTQALADFLNQPDTQGQLGAIGQAFSDVAKVTREVFLEALRQLLPIMAELAPVVSEIARVVGDLLVNALKIVGPILLEVARFLNDNKQAVADLAPLVLALWVAFKGASVLTAAITGLRALSIALGGPIALLKFGGLIALGGLAIKINEINKETAKIENRPLNDMEDTLDNLVGAGQQLITLDFDGIIADISGELQTVHDKFLDGTSPIGAFKDALTDATVAVRDFVVNAATDIGTFFSTTLPEKAGEVGKVVEDAMRTAATAVGDFFTTTVPGLVSDFFTSIGTGVSTGASTIGQVVSDTFQTIVDTVKAKIGEVVQGVSDFLSQTPHQIGFAIGVAIGEMINRIEEFGAMLHDRIVTFITDFGTTIQTGFDNAVTFATALPGRIGDAISGLAQTLATKAQEAGQAFLDWLGSFFTQTTDRASQVPGQVGGAVSGVVSTVGDKAREAGAAFLRFLTDAWNNTVSFAAGVPGRIGSAISSVVTFLGDKAREAGTAFLNALRTAFDEAVNFVKTVPQRLVSAIGNLGGLLIAAGKSFMDGLLSGIKAGYNAVAGFVSGIADGLKSIKGPLPYDGIVFKPAGLALMQGLLIGLQQGYATVSDFVGGVADQLAGSLNAGLTAGAVTVSTLPPPAATLAATAQAQSTDRLIEALGKTGVEVNVMLDGQPFAAMVTTAVVQQDRETARRVRSGSETSW
jgi:phage-related protein